MLFRSAEIQPYLDELEVPDQFTARQRIWPERPLQNVLWLLRNADHWFFDDEGPAATAILGLTSAQRAELWNNHQADFEMFDVDMDRVRQMCVGDEGEAVTDATALDHRMRLATDGAGTDEEGVLAAVAVAGSRRDELAEINRALESGVGPNRVPLTETQRAVLSERREIGRAHV